MAKDYAGLQPRLLIISHDIVGPVMAGPGIRYAHLARVLAQHVPTTLAVPGDAPPAGTYPFTVVAYRRRDWPSLAAQVAAADVCLFPSDVADELPQLAHSRACLVVDGYDPLMAEWLALSRDAEPAGRHRDWNSRMVALSRQYFIGDFYVCASERQRDWWLGLLEASGRVNPATFDADPSLRNLIDVVPYGLPETPLPSPHPVIKGVWPGIAPTDRLVLWGGGLWPWLDPVTAIRAVAALRDTVPTLRLVFPGTRHPNQAMAGMPNRTEVARATAAELGVLDQSVFFGDWAPYAEWPHVLQECDVALTLHFDTVETRLAFRSRVLEYIWADLPTVATRGDATSELIASHDLGVVVPQGDVAAVTAALDHLLRAPRTARAPQFAAARASLTWTRAAAPLIAYCRAPWRAADRPVDNGDPLRAPETYYDPVAALRSERDYWRTLAEGYARGRVMRVLQWVGQTKQRIAGR
jgi:glycosyltransferase involved in cell wall biosynthesis